MVNTLALFFWILRHLIAFVCRLYCISFTLSECGVTWNGLLAFLCDRPQGATVGQTLSSVEPSGEQESQCLSLLLLSYRNNISACTDSNINLFADDTSAYIVAKSSQAELG